MNEKIISIKGLTKRFGEFTAVDNVFLDIYKGEVFGFLGPNGSGKTTTIRMLCGILSLTAGEGETLGYDMRTETGAIKRRLGYMSQKFSLYNDLSVYENLEFYAGVYGIDGAARKNRIGEAIELAGLSGKEKYLVTGLSSAVKQRLALAAAILHNPEILFLDEPTGGVDPISRRNFWEVIYRLADEGSTIMVTTHYMDEAELCGRLAFIYEGRLIARGTPEELKQKEFTQKILRLECDPADGVFASLQKHGEIHDVYYYSGYLHIIVDDVQRGAALIRSAVEEQGAHCRYLEPVAPSLEDVFISLVERSARGIIRGKMNNGADGI